MTKQSMRSSKNRQQHRAKPNWITRRNFLDTISLAAGANTIIVVVPIGDRRLILDGYRRGDLRVSRWWSSSLRPIRIDPAAQSTTGSGAWVVFPSVGGGRDGGKGVCPRSEKQLSKGIEFRLITYLSVLSL